MYNLVKFILKYHFTILFIFLELLALLLIFQNNSYQKVKYLNTSNHFTGAILEAKAAFTDYFKLKEVNNQLAAENAQLKSKILSISYQEVPSLTTDTLIVSDTLLLDTILALKNYPAKVIGNSINKQLNIIFIDKGSNHHFYEDMGVVNQQGVVGVVKEVTKKYASITPIINRDFNINAKIKGSGYFGNLTWDGVSPIYAQLNDIPNHIEPKIGDTIVTSGYSQIFNEGIVIGYIDKVNELPGKSFININVRLAVEFGNLNYVYGLENFIKVELDSLQVEN
jgi:rod shape-determining protein MreC